MLSLLLLTAMVVRDQPLPPAWSPDHQVLATTKVGEGFVTPEGGNYSLLINGKVIYPPKPKHTWFHTYQDQHTFLSDVRWSPDSQRLAFVEEIYNWEYSDPYNRSFDGVATLRTFSLVIVSRIGIVTRYNLDTLPLDITPHWQSPQFVVLDHRTFDLRTTVTRPIR